MKLRLRPIASTLCIAYIAAFTTLSAQTPSLSAVDKALSFGVDQAAKLAESVEDQPGKFPVTLDKQGELVLCDTTAWTCGFFPGTLWYLYEYSNSKQIERYARLFNARLDGMEYATNTHDIGFIIYCSYGNGYRLTGDPSYRDKIVKAAESLCVRFNPIVGCIKSWDWGEDVYPVIIDNMMNLELLFEASKLTGNNKYRDVAITHANTTLENHFRDDASTFHVVFYDPATGGVRERKTRQGFADASTWSRGQAWALYGYTLCYRETRDPLYLRQAQKIASFILNHPRLPEDKIPYWDFDDTKIPDAPRDASAGAIIASALLELSGYVSGSDAKTYMDIAKKQLVSLSSPAYLAMDDSNRYFLLMHSVGSMPDDIEVDVPLSYADYYYVEALMRYRNMLESSKKTFVNEICLPSKLYMLDGVQNNIFVEALIKRWRPHNDVVRFSGTAAYQRKLHRVASIEDPAEGQTVQLQLVNTDDFETLNTLTSTIRVGTKGVGMDTVTVSIIGDSFTYGGFFKDALLTKGYVPKIRMVGLQEIDGAPGQFDEGRPGWTLQGYFQVSKERSQAYNGFWQPEGGRYWGSTAYWQLVHQVNRFPGKGWNPLDIYFTKRFYKGAVRFDENSGYKLNPAKNDIMYDNASETFKKYDGKRWVDATYEDFSWGFDYGKYLSMWDLPAPSILVEYLGLNDFRDYPNPSTLDFSTWNRQIELMAESYRKAVPNGKFVVMIPQSTCGILDNYAGDFTIRQNACMWELRKNIIENFDHREPEQIYIVDGGIAIDNLDGYNYITDEKYVVPYTDYPDIKKIDVQWGNPHPYPNYPVMGIPLAAFIQVHR